jgi:hypothetical protein
MNTPNRNQNFTAIKSFNCQGLYRDFPKQGKSLVEAFKSNDFALEFCKKHDVDIEFNAYAHRSGGVQNRFTMYYRDVVDGGLKKIISALKGQKRVEIATFACDSGVEQNFNKSAEEMKNLILPAKTRAVRPDHLDTQLHAITNMEEAIQTQKTAKREAEQKLIETLLANKKDNKNATNELNTAIKDLIDNQ